MISLPVGLLKVLYVGRKNVERQSKTATHPAHLLCRLVEKVTKREYNSQGKHLTLQLNNSNIMLLHLQKYCSIFVTRVVNEHYIFNQYEQEEEMKRS